MKTSTVHQQVCPMCRAFHLHVIYTSISRHLNISYNYPKQVNDSNTCFYIQAQRINTKSNFKASNFCCPCCVGIFAICVCRLHRMPRMYVKPPSEYLRGIYFIAVPYLFKIKNAVVNVVRFKDWRPSFVGENAPAKSWKCKRSYYKRAILSFALITCNKVFTRNFQVSTPKT